MKAINYFMRKEFIIYALVGALCALVDLSAFYALNILLNVSYLIAHILSVWLASTVKFFINKFFTFKNKSSKVKQQYAYSLIVLLVYIVITEIMLYIFVDFFHFDILSAKLLVLVLGLSINYVLDKKITFAVL